MEKLAKIQKELKATKDQFNKFGGYAFRSAESILEAVKPLLDGAILTLQDDIVLIGDRFYVKATAIFKDGDFTESTTAYAREPKEQKGMNESQITGASSSYARKYALNGLFCIDDNKDADTEEYHNQTNIEEHRNQKEEKLSVEEIIKDIEEKMTLDNWKVHYAKAIKLYPKGTEEFKLWSKIFNDKKKDLEKNQKKDELKEESEFLDSMAGDIIQDYYD